MTNKIHDLLFEQYGNSIFESNLLLEASTLSYILSPLKDNNKNKTNTTIKEVIKKLGIAADAPIIPIKDFHNQFLYNEVTCGNVVIIAYKDGTKQIIKRNYGKSRNYFNTYGYMTFNDDTLTPSTRSELGLPHGAKIGEPMNTFRKDAYFMAPYTRIQINKDNSIRKISEADFEDPKNLNKRITGYRAMQNWIGYGDAGDSISGNEDGRRTEPTDAIKQVFVIPFYHLTNNQFTFGANKEYIDNPNKVPFPVFYISILQYLYSKYEDIFDSKTSNHIGLSTYLKNNQSMYDGEYIILKNKTEKHIDRNIGNWLDFTNSYKNDYRNEISENISLFVINKHADSDRKYIKRGKYKTADSKSLINNKLVELLQTLKDIISIDPNSKEYYEIKTKLLVTKDLISRCIKSKMVPKLDRLYTRLNYYNSLIERKNNLNAFVNKRNSIGFNISEPIIKTSTEGQNILKSLKSPVSGSPDIIKKDNILYQMAILQIKDIDSTIKKKDLNKERLMKEIDYIIDNIDVSKIYDNEVRLKKTIKEIEKLYIKIVEISVKAKEECDKKLEDGSWKLATYKVQYSNRLLPIRKIEDQIEKLKESIKDEYELLEMNIKSSIKNIDSKKRTDSILHELEHFSLASDWDYSVLWRPSHPALTKIISNIKLGGTQSSYVLGNVVDALEEYNIHTNSEIIPIKDYIARNTKKGVNIDNESIKDFIYSPEIKNKKILWVNDSYINILSNFNDNKVRQANISLDKGSLTSKTIYLNEIDLFANELFIVNPPKVSFSKSSYSPEKYLEYLNIVRVIGDSYYHSKKGIYTPVSITNSESDGEYDPNDPFNL